MNTEQFHLFYGGPFSNWTTATFVVDGKTYHTAEQYMMAEKARMFGDKESETKIMATRDPERAKALGRQVRGFKREVWDAKARDIVYKGCYAKFQQNKGLLHALMETKGKTLVEASPTDQIWGVGFSSDNPKARDRRFWRGTNWLGEVLTLVREDLEAGIYRTDNFCWSGTKPVENDVQILNETQHELWIWDNDKMRRWAYDLKHDFENVKDINVIVREHKFVPPERTKQPYTFVEVEVTLTRGEELLSTKGTSRESVLAACKSALGKMKTSLGGECPSNAG